MTIEERAKEYADNFIVGDAAIIADLLHKVAYDSFKAGATDQQKIDIENACEWLKEHKLLNDEYKGLYTRYGGLSEFRKAMEE